MEKKPDRVRIWAGPAGEPLAAGLTALYMFRVVHLTFHGEFRGSAEQRNHLHESPAVMTLPLIVLAVGSVVVGLLGIPKGMTLNLVELCHCRCARSNSINRVLILVMMK